MRFLLVMTLILGIMAAQQAGIFWFYITAGGVIFFFPLNRFISSGERHEKTFHALDLLDRVEDGVVVTFSDLISYCDADMFLLRKLESRQLIHMERTLHKVRSKKTGNVLVERSRRKVYLTSIGRRWLEQERERRSAKSAKR